MQSLGSTYKGLKKFFELEAASSVVLVTTAIVAFVLANSRWSTSYFSYLETQIFGLTLKHWINDGLMALFFFMVGLEVKREFVFGHLNSVKNATLPVVAAVGGMVLPALIFTAINESVLGSKGWGIPMATDIAFAIGVLTLLGSRVPTSLKVFLLTVAIVDDIGAILVIAFFYTGEIRGLGLSIATAGVLLVFMLQYFKVNKYIYYWVLGTIVWAGFLYSGVHATIAGVILGLITPVTFFKSAELNTTYSPLEELIHWIHPFVNFGIMPIFAFANSGLDLRGINFSDIVFDRLSLAVIFGLLVGKPVGIFLFSYLSTKIGATSLPKGLNWGLILGVGCLSGIGFTMSLFISGLALPVDLEVFSKTGILVGSILSGVGGSILLRIVLKRMTGPQISRT